MKNNATVNQSRNTNSSEQIGLEKENRQKRTEEEQQEFYTQNKTNEEFVNQNLHYSYDETAQSLTDNINITETSVSVSEEQNIQINEHDAANDEVIEKLDDVESIAQSNNISQNEINTLVSPINLKPSADNNQIITDEVNDESVVNFDITDAYVNLQPQTNNIELAKAPYQEQEPSEPENVNQFSVSAISDTDSAANSVNESASNGSVVGITAFASDGDASDSVSYTLSDDAGGAFTIDSTTGEVTVADSSLLDYETSTSMTIEVTATSTDGSTSVQSYNIGVSDDTSESSVSAISDTDSAANSVNESASNGSVVGITAFASDGDASDSVSYTLSDDAGGAFTIDSTTGEVTVADSSLLDYETSTSMTIEVTATSTDGSTSVQSYNVGVSDDTSEFNITGITDTDTNANSVNESASNGSVVGITAFASDGDASDSVSYTLSDDAGGAFTIDSTTGEVTVADSSLLDYETSTSMTIEVTATSTDDSTSVQSYNVGVSDDTSEFNITGITDTDTNANSVNESASNGSVVGITAFASDGDASDSVSYTLSDDAGGAFTIDSTTGEVTVADSSLLDYETSTSMTIEVTATSTDGSTSVQSYNVDINDINEAPDDINLSNLSVDENIDGEVIGTLTTSDVDVGDSHSYTVNDDRFEVIDDGSGNVKLKLKEGVSLDHETTDKVHVTVTSTDSGGLETSQEFSIDVNDINEAPSKIVLDAENSVNTSILPQADFTAGDGYEHSNSLSDLGLETGSNVFTLSFDTASDVSSSQTLFETGGSGTGLNVVIDDGMLKVYAGEGNDLELSVPIDGDTSYNFALEVNKDDDTLTMLLSDTLPLVQMTVENSLVDSQENWTDNDWDGGNHIAVGQIGGGSSQGNIGGDFLGSINDSGLNVYANSEFEDVLLGDGSIDENVEGAIIGTLTTSDVDVGDSHSYTVNDDRFEVIDDGSGNVKLKLKEGMSLDHETTGKVHVTVTSTDSGGLETSQEFSIDVNDINEAPTSITFSQMPQADFTAGDGYEHSNSLSDLGLETGSNVFTLSFDTASDVSSSQTLFETGGSGTGLNVVIDDGMLKVYAGEGNDLELSVPIDGDTSYNFALEVNKDDDTLTMLLSDTLPLVQMTVENSLVDSQENWTDNDWDGGNHIAVGQIGGGSSQGNIGGDFLGSINDSGLNVYANSEFEDVLLGDGSIDENVEGAIIGTLTTSDVDVGDSHSYTVNDDRFEVIDDGSGNVKLKLKEGMSLDHETTDKVHVTVTSTDSGGLETSQEFSIDVNDDTSEFSVSAISDTDSAANSVNESASNGSVVGITAFASDGDASDSVSYTLSDDAGGAFTIDSTTGEVTVADSSLLDYETSTSMTIEVTATSTDGSTSVQSYNIGVSDDTSEFSVSAISDTDSAANSVNESASNGSVVGITAFASDGDASDSVSYTLSDDAGGAFTIDSTTGEVTVADSSLLDYETSTSMTIEVTATSTDGSTSVQSYNIGVSDDTSEFSVSAISDTDSAANSVNESASNGSVVGITAFASDGDASDSVSYTLSDDAGGAFTIDSTTGEVTVADSSLLDYETSTSMTIEVTATSTDDSTSVQSYNVGVSDDTSEFNITGITDTDTNANSVNESASNGSVVGITAFASDGDASDSVSYTLSDDAGGAFTIDSTTGEVTVADSSLLDYETSTSMTIEVTATSTDGSTSVQSYNIGVSDDTSEFSVSAISDTDSAANSVNESASNGSVVGITAFASDGDASDSVSYTLSDDAGGAFTIDSTTGEVTVADSSLLDYETSTSMTIEVTATSTDGSTSVQSYNIDINDINEVPTDMTFGGNSSLSSSVSNAGVVAANTVVADAATVVDVDSGDTHTFSLSDDANGMFTIDSNTGEISLVSEHSVSTSFSDNVTVEVADSAGNVYSETVGIQLGTQGDDTLTGSSNTDIMYSLDGADTLNGGSGDDMLYASDGITSIGGTNTVGKDYSLIRLGNAADIDTNEGNGISENVSDLLGNYGDSGNPLYNEIVSAKANDTDGDNRLDDNDYGKTAETFTINGSDYELDSVQVYDASVNFTDGTSGSFSAVVIQLENGDVYLSPEYSSNSDSSLLESKPIESISLDSVLVDNTNLYGSRLDSDYAIHDSGDTLNGGTGDDTLVSGGADDVLNGEDGNDMFIFSEGDGTDSINGGSGGGWTDTIHLDDSSGGSNIGAYGTDWTLNLTEGSVQGSDANSLDLSDDADGQIVMQDGSTINFTDIERIEW